MKSLLDKFELSSLLLLIALCILTSEQSNAAQSASSSEQRANQSQEQSVVKTASEPSVIVAKIADYIITREQFENRFLNELYPNEYEYSDEEAGPIDANSALMIMIAEKAMIIEARKQNYQEDESIKKIIKRFSERRLVSLLRQNHLKEMMDKIIATEAEIQKMIQADPNTDPKRAKLNIENTKASANYHEGGA